MPARELESVADGFQWIHGNGLVFCLIVIAVWAYVGFHIQSRCAHNNPRREGFVGYKSETDSFNLHGDIENAVASLGSSTTSSSVIEHIAVDKGKDPDLKKFSLFTLAQDERDAPSDENRSNNR